MTKPVLAFTVIFSIFALSLALQCEENAEPGWCANYCILTCSHPNLMPCMPNPTACKRGCKCKTGYVRHEGKCIDKDDCPKSSGHQHHPRHLENH